jgi:hypothetical protein
MKKIRGLSTKTKGGFMFPAVPGVPPSKSFFTSFYPSKFDPKIFMIAGAILLTCFCVASGLSCIGVGISHQWSLVAVTGSIALGSGGAAGYLTCKTIKELSKDKLANTA